MLPNEGKPTSATIPEIGHFQFPKANLVVVIGMFWQEKLCLYLYLLFALDPPNNIDDEDRAIGPAAASFTRCAEHISFRVRIGRKSRRFRCLKDAGVLIIGV